MFLQIRARKMEGLSYLPLHISHLLSHSLFLSVSCPRYPSAALRLCLRSPPVPRNSTPSRSLLSARFSFPLSLASLRDPRRAIAASKRSL